MLFDVGTALSALSSAVTDERVPPAVHMRVDPAPTRAILKVLQELTPVERRLLADMVGKQVEVPPRVAERVLSILNSQRTGSDLLPLPPANLAQVPQPAGTAKTRHAQLQTLVIVLIWLMAIIVPIVQQRLGAEAQSITDAEVGTASLALAITTLMKQARK